MELTQQTRNTCAMPPAVTGTYTSILDHISRYTPELLGVSGASSRSPLEGFQGSKRQARPGRPKRQLTG